MFVKMDNLLKKFWRVILLGFVTTLITIGVINLLDSQNEFNNFKNSETVSLFWNTNTYKNNREFNELVIVKNKDLINNNISLEFNNEVEMVEISTLNGKELDKVFNYEILSNPKDSIKEFQINKNSILLKLIPNKGIAKVKIGFKDSINKKILKIEDQLLVKIFNHHTADWS